MSSFSARMLASAGVLAITALSAGCVQKIDRLRREQACRDEVTTPSVEAARAVRTEKAVAHRSHAAIVLQAEDGTVTHAPLFFEDPYEEAESEEYCVVWSPMDYLHSWLYGPARFAANAALFPVSVGVSPPCVVMASDGQPSRSVVGMKHDAQRWTDEHASPPVVK